MASKRAIVGCAIGGENVKLEEAQEHANRLLFVIADLCEKVEVVGSIRRKRPEVHDIDVIVIPKFDKPFYSLAWDHIATRLKKELNMQVIRKGPSLMTLGFGEVDLPVDIYRAQPGTWGVLLLIRTGSTQHNIMLCSKAQQMGMKLSAKEGVIKNGKVIASRTEQEIFTALDMKFVPPEEREC